MAAFIRFRSTCFSEHLQVDALFIKQLSRAIFYSEYSYLKETRNSFKKWPLNLRWTLNKTIAEVGNITKAATKVFLS